MRAAHGVDHAVDDAQADAVARHAHGSAGQPAVVHGVVTVQHAGVHVSVRSVVPAADRIQQAADDAGRESAAGHLQIRQPQPGSGAGVKSLQIAERLPEVASGRVDELRDLGRPAGDELRGLVQREVLEDLRQVVFALGVPVEALQLTLQEERCERVAADGLQQSLDIRTPVLPVVLDPLHTRVEHLGLAAHVQLVAADQRHQLAVRQVEELLLRGHLRDRQVRSDSASTHTHTHTHSLSLTRRLTCTRIHTLCRTHTLLHNLLHTRTYTHSLTHTHYT